MFEFIIKNTDFNNFDIIISDPPAFAKHLNSVNTAVIGYTRLNTVLLEKAKSKSILFTFSCSQLIDNVSFKKIIYRNLYPDIDVEYVFHPEDGIKYSLILHPGADISKVKMICSNPLLQIENGDLQIHTKFGNITDHAPVTF